jgi:PEP-CTERM motif
MKKQTLACIATMAFMATVSSAWANQYTYTFSGADLMSYSTDEAVSGTPAANGFLDDARRFTSTEGDASSSWLTDSRSNFTEMADNFGYSLAVFNLWGFGGFGGADAADWGETYSVGSWTNSGTADMGWTSFLYSDAGTFGKEVLAFARTLTGDAISFQALSWPTFTFTIDLPDSTVWHNGNPGELVFWFGGYMVENATDLRAGLEGRLQGNMILEGQPVPEPATMLLFGAGLAGLAAVGRRNRKGVR